LKKWLQRSVHRTAILEVARRQAAPDVMALLSELFPITLHGVPERPRRGAVAISVAVCAAACVVAVGTWMFNHQQVCAELTPLGFSRTDGTHPPVIKQDYSTEVGQQRQVKLPDGSTLVLNTDSSVTVNYSLRERGIHLTRGEVTFSVAQEADRPFLVRVGH